MNKNKAIAALAILLLCAGCDPSISTPIPPTPPFVTATLPPTAVPIPTATPLPPTPVPTIKPITGRTTAEVNVRSETSTAGQSLGVIAAFSAVQIIGRDASGLWLQIVFNQGSGWVRADFVQVENATAEIPVVDAGAGSGSGVRGVVLRGVNVRRGPARDFESLGLLNQNDVVSILGKDSSGAWMRIRYAASPDGTGWVALEFLQVDHVEAIPVINEAAQPIGTNPTGDAGASSPAGTVRMDGDSAAAPLAMFTLSAASSRSVQFQGQVSAPDGDGEDWIGFSSTSQKVFIQIACESGNILVELIQPGGAPGGPNLECGASQPISIIQEQTYLMRIASIVLNEDSLVRYTITIRTEG